MTKVAVLPAYQLKVRFFDSSEGVVDTSELVLSPDAGVFGVLPDPVGFAEVYVRFGVVTWPGGIDLAPDATHAAIRANAIQLDSD